MESNKIGILFLGGTGSMICEKSDFCYDKLYLGGYMLSESQKEDFKKKNVKTLILERPLSLDGGIELTKEIINKKQNQEKIKNLIKDYKILILVCGIGGTFSSVAFPFINELAKKENIIIYNIISKPFGFEGRKRNSIYIDAIEKCKKDIDNIYIINYDTFLKNKPKKTTVVKLFEELDAFFVVLINNILNQIESNNYASKTNLSEAISQYLIQETEYKLVERINGRWLSDEEIEKLFYIKNNKLKNINSEIKVEEIIKNDFPNFSFLNFNANKKNALIYDLLNTNGNAKYNSPKLICQQCNCRYIVKLTGGFIRKQKQENNNLPLTSHRYGCIVDGTEKNYQCLGCGYEW